MNMQRHLWAKAINRRLGLAIIAGLAAALAGAGAARAATPITTCGYIISAPGNYVLAADIGSPTPCTGHGISIAVSNVNLTLNGHTITGNGVVNNTSYDGIDVYGNVSNIQVQGSGLIRDFGIGIFLYYDANSRIQEVVTVSNNIGIFSVYGTNLQFNANVVAAGGQSAIGFDLYGDRKDEVEQNEAIGNYYGIVVQSGSGNRMNNNSFDGNFNTGIYIIGGSNNHIGDNAVFGNGVYGIAVGSSAGNDIHDNIAEGNVTYDLFDNTTSPACDTDTWHDNVFFTANQPCIH